MTGNMRVTFYWVWQSLSLFVLTIIYWEGSSGPGQGFSSQSEIGELILQDHQQIRHFSLNMCGSQEVSEEPYKFCAPLWSCAGWSSLSFQLNKNFVLNQSSFSQSFIKTNILLPKVSLSKNEQFPETSMKTFFSELPPIPHVECISPTFLWEKQRGFCLILWDNWRAQADCSVTHLVAMTKNLCPHLTLLALSP